MTLNKPILLLLFWSWAAISLAQQTFPKNGVYDQRDGHYAFTNATIQVSPTQQLKKASLLIKKGKVVAVGTNIDIPNDAIQIDLAGKFIYPSFIDLHTAYGMPKPKAAGTRPKQQPQMVSNKKGAYSWNEALKSETRADELFTVNKAKAKEWRNLGFGTVLSHHRDGIARGTSSLVLLGEEREHEMIINNQVAAHYSFGKGTSTQNYPSSRMGAIALLRQTHYDAQWYKANPDDREYNISLEKWLAIESLPQIFEVGNRLDMLRAAKVGKEFGVTYIFRGRGDEYLRLDEIKQTGSAIILPVNFPKPYDVSDPYTTQEVSLTQMKHWELAPTNPAKLAKAGIKFALTTDYLKDKKTFWTQVKQAYKFGLSEEDILKALTTTPAQLIGADKELGTLEQGKIANFIITSHNILADKVTIYHNWVNGKPYALKDINTIDIRGKYELTLEGKKHELEVNGSLLTPDIHLKDPNQKDKKKKGTKLKYTYANGTIAFTIIPKKDTSKKAKTQAIYRLSGNVTAKAWSGNATKANGDWATWSAKRTGDVEIKEPKLPKLDSTVMGKVVYPFAPYGVEKDQLPTAKTVIIQNTTVWTGEKQGKLTNTDVLIQDGKITKIGKKLKAKGATLIDGTNKHLTAGIIDEHSHIAINYGVNEGTQASSAEVRIGDVINSEDVNLYRQLAGGVTMAQLLHGSANPIGGQAALIKFRWGQAPEQMKYEGADGFIKFALGENVKQSNWGDNNRHRFPQTRMGVEQVYEDYFTRAREYEKLRKEKGDKIRRDLELDAVLEILNKKRFITCHSYVQSEITMLMRMAERHGFRINTFTHILEGYKIADKMAKHGAGGSTFSDWWAYKAEVMDAIPYNPKLLNSMNVVIAINSDDAEMGRRLNQEAAKGVKYGGMSEEDAWNMVTLNPAKLLHVDDKVGSIKVGKDADVVLWSDNPLSVYARAEKTFVDGICRFDVEEDKKLRKALQAERSRLIQKMLNKKAAGVKTQPPVHTHKHHYHCGDIENNNFIDYNID
ncbi:MAG: amidohydrolase family protein [Aureispira sp.]|nr:amidohydrolase family protein [Aureispira sp.]